MTTEGIVDAADIHILYVRGRTDKGKQGDFLDVKLKKEKMRKLHSE